MDRVRNVSIVQSEQRRLFVYSAIWVWFACGLLALSIFGPHVWLAIFYVPWMLAHFCDGFLFAPVVWMICVGDGLHRIRRRSR
jgi:hypothetical protein